MKRFLSVVIATLALLVPTVAAASDAPRLVYRPELRAYVPVAEKTAKPAAPAITLTPAEIIARHQPMAAGLRAKPRGNIAATAHCDRLIAEARAAAKKSF